MSVRLERNIGCAAACLITSSLQGDRFGVFDLVVEIKTFAHDLAVRISDDSADEWPRAHLTGALRREGKCSLHHLLIELVLISQLYRSIMRRGQYHVRQQVGSTINPP